MKCPKKDKIIAYANGEIEDAKLSEEIERHIQSCEKCEIWLETYRVLQEVGDEINPEPEKIPDFEMNPKLEAAIAEQTVETHWWDVFTKWADSLQRPAWVIGGAVALLIVAVFVWKFIQNEPQPFSIAGVNYRVWGDKSSLESLKIEETPPALQSQQVSRYIGFLTDTLIKVLQRPKDTDEFWKALEEALDEQKITMPQSLRTLVIEESLFSDIKVKQVISDQEIWILFYKGQIMIIQWAD